MVLGSGLAYLGGYPFEVRYSDGSLVCARAAADITRDAYVYFKRLFSVEPDIAVIVASEADWESRQPYGLPFFNDDEGQIRPGIVVMPAGSGDFWAGMGQDIRDASPRGYARLLAAYPGVADGLDLQPFFDLVTIHELGHAFEVLGDLRLPAFWLGEIFADLALHAFVATRQHIIPGPAAENRGEPDPRPGNPELAVDPGPPALPHDPESNDWVPQEPADVRDDLYEDGPGLVIRARMAAARNGGEDQWRQVPVVVPQPPVLSWMFIEYGLMGAPLGWTLSAGPPG